MPSVYLFVILMSSWYKKFFQFLGHLLDLLAMLSDIVSGSLKQSHDFSFRAFVNVSASDHSTFFVQQGCTIKALKAKGEMTVPVSWCGFTIGRIWNQALWYRSYMKMVFIQLYKQSCTISRVSSVRELIEQSIRCHLWRLKGWRDLRIVWRHTEPSPLFPLEKICCVTVYVGVLPKLLVARIKYPSACSNLKVLNGMMLLLRACPS